MSKTIPASRFILDNDLIVTAKPVKNPVLPPFRQQRETERGDAKYMHYHAVAVERDGSDVKLEIVFGQKALNKPTPEEVLQVLVVDAQCYDGSNDIDDFAADFFGFVPGETKISHVVQCYEACKDIATKLRAMLGDEAYETLTGGGVELP